VPEVVYRAGPLKAAVLGYGAFVPEHRVSNDELARTVDTSDAWIRQRTGIAERRVARAGMTTAELALPAARAALERAEVLPSELDLIVLGTTSPDRPFPSTACDLQRMLGSETAMAMDVLAACSSWLYAVSTAERYIATGAVKRALVVGAEVMTRLLDYGDRGTCVLFGDGAGAAVLGPSTTAGFESFVLGADGRKADLIYYGTDQTHTEDRLRMNGAETFRVAPKTMEGAARRACEAAGVDLADIDVVVPHQANARIVEVLARRLQLPIEKFLVNIENYGNTSSASIPLVLDEAVNDGRIRPGNRILLVTFGAGLTWGATVLTCGA
jgi:3-oxoacyl-[acyl-carrier-protein] synthase-3